MSSANETSKELQTLLSEIQNTSENFKGLIDKAGNILCAEAASLEKEKEVFLAMRKKLEQVQLPKTVELNIGGTRFTTSLETLRSTPSFFSVMFSGNWELKATSNGDFFIDRDGVHFRYILNFLRNKEIVIPGDEFLRRELLKEAQFYCLDDMIKELSTPTTFFVGGSLLSSEHQKKLNEWYGNPNQQWTLLYKGSANGFQAANFHSLCNSKGPTISVMKSTSNHLFGGYSPIAWTSRNNYVYDQHTFIFTLTNPHGLPPTKYSNTGPSHSNAYSIYDNASYGPTFGGGHDIMISGAANSTNCSSNFPHSFQDISGLGSKTFAGGNAFLLSDIEVFGLK